MGNKRKMTWAYRLNRLLVPYIGPPPLGPYNQPPLPPVSESDCPMCGVVMSAHEVERRDGRPTKLHCPSAA